jgi:branched-chain amino acid transport system substrate-binding protein
VEEDEMRGSTIRTYVQLVMILAMIPFLAACAQPADEGPIRIGLQAPFTGVGADYGPIAERSVRLAFDQVGWKVAGRPIVLTVGDEDALDPSVTLDWTKKLVEQTKVNILIGPIFGSNQQAIQPYLSEQKLVDISVHNGDWGLRESGNFFIWPGTDYGTALPAGTFAYEEMGYRTLSVMAPDYIYGHTLMAGPMDAFKEKGGTIVQEQWVPLGTIDMLPYVTALSRDADAILVWLLPDNFVGFLQQYHALGLTTPVFMIHSMREDQLQELGPQINGFYTLTDYTWRINNPTNKSFVAAFEAAYNDKPDQTDASAYSAALVAIKALEANGGDASFEAMKKAIAGLKLDTPLGKAYFSANGFAVTDRQMTRVAQVDGLWVYDVVKTYTAVMDPRDK